MEFDEGPSTIMTLDYTVGGAQQSIESPTVWDPGELKQVRSNRRTIGRKSAMLFLVERVIWIHGTSTSSDHKELWTIWKRTAITSITINSRETHRKHSSLTYVHYK